MNITVVLAHSHLIQEHINCFMVQPQIPYYL